MKSLFFVLFILFSGCDGGLGNLPVSGCDVEKTIDSPVFTIHAGAIFGKIVPVKTKHSYRGNFKCTKDSHAIIRIYSEENSDNTRTIATHRIDSITKFPIRFSIPIDEVLKEGVLVENLRFDVKVLSGPGDDAKVGDFVTEEMTPVKTWTRNRVEVVGLESCQDSHSGGFCV